MYRKHVKRWLGAFLALVGIICLSWLLIIISIIIFIDDPGPVIFKQKRVGQKKNGELTYFNIYKFRTMCMDTPSNIPTHMLENPDAYITRAGHVLRKLSADELLQLFNILKGDMSICGPRPALWNQNDLIAEREKYGAHDIRPGLTGWAQIHGRDELEIEEKAKLDGYYVEHLSFFLDIKIFLLTILSVFRSDGVVEGGTGTIHRGDSKVK